jgi:hypothetical protein
MGVPAQGIAGHDQAAGEQSGPERNGETGEQGAAEEERPEGETEEGRAGISAAAAALHLGHGLQASLYRGATHLPNAADYLASWKMTPRENRWPLFSRLTPWRIVTR